MNLFLFSNHTEQRGDVKSARDHSVMLRKQQFETIMKQNAVGSIPSKREKEIKKPIFGPGLKGNRSSLRLFSPKSNETDSRTNVGNNDPNNIAFKSYTSSRRLVPERLPKEPSLHDQDVPWLYSGIEGSRPQPAQGQSANEKDKPVEVQLGVLEEGHKWCPSRSRPSQRIELEDLRDIPNSAKRPGRVLPNSNVDPVRLITAEPSSRLQSQHIGRRMSVVYSFDLKHQPIGSREPKHSGSGLSGSLYCKVTPCSRINLEADKSASSGSHDYASSTSLFDKATDWQTRFFPSVSILQAHWTELKMRQLAAPCHKSPDGCQRIQDTANLK
ncbi:unnamed protein product, partial [Protopolystoma xenopodis]